MRRTNFTKRDFEFLAEYMKENRPDDDYKTGGLGQWENMALDLAYRLQTTNEHFKQETFLKACGYEV